MVLRADVFEPMVIAAHKAGVHRAQVENFITGGYVPLPDMLPFHIAARMCDVNGGPDEVGIGGTRGPGKSHATFAQVALDDCQRVAGLKWLFLRKVQKSAGEAFEDLSGKVLKYVKHERNGERVMFPNGSRILIGGFNDEGDIDKYLGIEYDGLVMEEATQISEIKKQKIYGSIRTTVTGWRARKYLTTNPDGIGLSWFKKTFVIPWREKREGFTRFIPGDYRNNPFLDDGYIRYLEGLTGALGKAWRDADWDAFEGMAFPNWNYERHVIKPFTIPDDWYKWRAVDWGYANPWCCGWFAQKPGSRRVYLYREAYERLLTDSQQVQRILQMTPPAEKIKLTYADPSMWARKNVENTVTTTADTYLKGGVELTKADNDRLGGKRKIDNMLGDLDDGEPGFQMFSTCTHLIEQMSTLIFDPVHTEDVDTDMEDHAYDYLRYGLTSIREIKPPKPQQPNQWLCTDFGG